MLLLLDECVPRPLKREFVGHDASHVVDMGWSSKLKGELLQLMLAAEFAALPTVDQNLEFQQNVRACGVGVIVLLAKTNRHQGTPTARVSGPRRARATDPRRTDPDRRLTPPTPSLPCRHQVQPCAD
jgi:hypothetical protein